MYDEDEAAVSVIEYLHQHPQAADSLDGIVQWWLPRQRYETARERIGQILEKLVVDGILRSQLLADGTAVYSLREKL